MNCSDFQTDLDLYLDAALDSAKMSAAGVHVAACTGCNHVVTDHQKARALLITAVADRAAAVDVSGLWDEISQRLDERKANVTWLDAFRGRRLFTPRRTRVTRPAAVRVGAFAATAAAAALIVSLFTGNPSQTQSRIQTPNAPVGPIASATGGVAQSRPVRIDSMEIGAGKTVSTWIKPRTKTRVIWVMNSNAPAYSVSSISETR